jgi:hypothetical protein
VPNLNHIGGGSIVKHFNNATDLVPFRHIIVVHNLTEFQFLSKHIRINISAHFLHTPFHILLGEHTPHNRITIGNLRNFLLALNRIYRVKHT